MATIASLVVELRADATNLNNALADVQRDMKEMEKTTRATQTALKDFGGAMTSAGQSLSVGLSLPIVAFGVVAVKNFGESAEAVAQLEAVLKSTGGVAGKTKDQMIELATSLQNTSLYDDDAILRSVIGQLLTFKNVSGDAFDRGSQAAVNMAAKLNEDLQSATIRIGKALQDPVAGVTALKKVGVELTDQQKDLINSFMKVGDVAGAQGIILDELSSEFDGAAQAAAKAGTGPFKQLQIQIGNLTEAFGKIIVDALIPLVGYVSDAVKWIDGLSDSTKTSILVVAGLLAAIGPLLIVLGSMATGLASIISIAGTVSAVLGSAGLVGALGAVVAIITGPVGIAIAIGAAVTALIYFINQTEEGHKALSAFWDMLVKFGAEVWDLIKTTAEFVAALAEIGWDVMVAQAKDFWNQLVNLYDALVDMKDAVLGFFGVSNETAWTALGYAIKIAFLPLTVIVETLNLAKAGMKAFTGEGQPDKLDPIHEGLSKVSTGMDVVTKSAVKANDDITAAQKKAQEEQLKIDKDFRAAQAAIYKEHVDAALKLVQQQAKDEQDVASADAKQIEKIYKDLYDDIDKLKAQAVVDDQKYNDMIFAGKLDLYKHDAEVQADIYATSNTEALARIAEITKGLQEHNKQVAKAAKDATDEQIREYQRMGDEFARTMVNMDNSLASTGADMIIHGKFTFDSLKNIAEDTAQSMLTSFLKGLIKPLTDQLTTFGASLGDMISGALGIGTAPVPHLPGGAAGPVLGGAGLSGAITGIGSTGGTSLLGMGGSTSILAGAAPVLAIAGPIAAGAAALIGWVKSQAHWEANDLVDHFQAPFDAQYAALFDQVTQNQASMSAADVLDSYNALHDLWVQTTNTVVGWEGTSKDRQVVGGQFFATEIPMLSQQFQWMSDLVAQKNAQESGLVSYDVGTRYVPQDGPAYLHKGEAVIPAAQNNGGMAGGVSATFHITVGAGSQMTVSQLRDQLIPELKAIIEGDVRGLATTVTKKVKTTWNSVVTA